MPNTPSCFSAGSLSAGSFSATSFRAGRLWASSFSAGAVHDPGSPPRYATGRPWPGLPVLSAVEGSGAEGPVLRRHPSEPRGEGEGPLPIPMLPILNPRNNDPDARWPLASHSTLCDTQSRRPGFLPGKPPASNSPYFAGMAALRPADSGDQRSNLRPREVDARARSRGRPTIRVGCLAVGRAGHGGQLQGLVPVSGSQRDRFPLRIHQDFPCGLCENLLNYRMERRTVRPKAKKPTYKGEEL
jgi:hypothetical protein